MNQEELEHDEWGDAEDEQGEPVGQHQADAQQMILARQQQLLSKLRGQVQQAQQQPAVTYGRSSGGQFPQGAMVPVRHTAPIAQYEVPVQYVPYPQSQQRDWIALVMPLSLCFTTLTLGGMAIMAGNAPREHDAYMMAKLAEATKAVAERPASNNICIALMCPAVGDGQAAQPPVSTFVDHSQPFSFQEYLDRLNQQYGAGQVTEEMQRTFDQWVNHFQQNQGEFTTALNNLSKPQCDAEPIKCAAISWVYNAQQQNAAFTQVPTQPQAGGIQ